MKFEFLLTFLLFFSFFYPMQAQSFPFQNPDLPLENRLDDLITRLSLQEKVSLMTHTAASIDRLGIPAYHWWNEALHGVARAAPATVFPQAIGLAATFNTDLMESIAEVIAGEGRAMFHRGMEKGIHKQYMGLTYWSPNVNIFRDPRWGRGHETYGEDPYLSGELGAAFVRGIQGNDPTYLKAAACAKHFAVHNGPEAKRHEFDAPASKKDLYETYLPAFKRLVDEGVAGVMCAYNRTNGDVCCGHQDLLVKLLREEWKFNGYVVSDCWALSDFYSFHKVTKTAEESAALALKAQVNVNCGVVYSHLEKAVEQKLVREEQIDQVLKTQLRIRFQLGLFDPADRVPFARDYQKESQTSKARQLARKAAQQSIVLLKNENQILPLSKDIPQLYVTGHNAADVNVLLANYFGVGRNMVTILEGIAGKVSPTTVLQYSQGMLLDQKDTTQFGMVWNAASADATIAVIGNSPLLEGENGDAIASDYGGDRQRIEISKAQVHFLKALKEQAKEKPLIVVVCGGGAIAMPEVHDIADALLLAWYPGEQGGNGLADVLFGDVAPSGRLPITFYRSTEQLGDYEDYRIAEGGRTYKYFKGDPLYPFGFGLTYGNINYELDEPNSLNYVEGKSLSLSVTLTNNNPFEIDECVQLYITSDDAPFPVPQYALKSIQKISLQAGERRKVTFEVTEQMLQQIDMEGKATLIEGEHTVWIGATSPSERATQLGAPAPVKYKILVP